MRVTLAKALCGVAAVLFVAFLVLIWAAVAINEDYDE